MSEEWIDSWRQGSEFLQHLGGVDWMDAPKPRRWHKCKPQTRGEFGLELVERCACGGARLFGFGPWVERNSR